MTATSAGGIAADLLHVRDLVPDYLAYRRDCHDVPRERWPALWRSRYLDRHPDVFAALDREGDWSGADDLGDTLARLRERDDDLARRSARVRAGLPDSVEAVARAMGWSGDGDPFECVVLVGLHRANGWADTLNGRYALFLAVEQLGDDDDLLVLHEAAHVVHDRLAGIRDWPEHGVAGTLLAEGLATQVSAETAPGLPDETYLWFGRPGYRQWLDDCRRSWPDILARISGDLDATDLDHFTPYFLMRDSPLRGHLPKRCGYLVGLAAVRQLREHHSLHEIATWDLARVTAEIRRILNDLATP